MNIKWLWGDNYVNIQGRNMVHVHSPSPHYHLSIKQVSFKSQQQFLSYLPDKTPNGRTDRRIKWRLYASPFEGIKMTTACILQCFFL